MVDASIRANNRDRRRLLTEIVKPGSLPQQFHFNV
jgi:hypothetical protein